MVKENSYPKYRFSCNYDLRKACHPELDSGSLQIPGQARNDKTA